MERTMKYVKNAAMVLLSGLTLFIAIGLTLLVLEAITADELGDWSLKALLVTGVLFAANFVVGLLMGIAGKGSTDKK